MKLFVTFLFALLLSFPAYAGGKADCDERCQAYKHGPLTGLKPAVPREICVVAPYGVSGEVQLTLYRRDRSIRRRLKRHFDLHRTKYVTFCLGPQWFNDETMVVDLCNAVNHSDRDTRDSHAIQEARRSHVLPMCLLGSEGCRNIYRAGHF